MRTSFRFSGTGGQGLITAGIILAEAALLDDKLAVQSQSYGPEARGGSSKAEAIAAGKFPIGVLYENNDVQEYTAAYDEIIKRAQEGK